MSQKILVVEDQLFMLRLIQHTLAKAGYELIEARSSEEARAALVNEKPSLVVGDPKVVEGSLEPNDSSNSNADRPTPVPMICVSDEPPTSASGQKVDGEVVFTKPFSPMKLIAEVKRLSSAANATATEGDL